MLSAFVLSAMLGSSFYFDNKQSQDPYLVICGGEVLHPCLVPGWHDDCFDIDPFSFDPGPNGFSNFTVFYFSPDGSGNKQLNNTNTLAADLPGGTWTAFPDGYYTFNDGDWTWDPDSCNPTPPSHPRTRARKAAPGSRTQGRYTIANESGLPLLFIPGDAIDAPATIDQGGQATLSCAPFDHGTIVLREDENDAIICPFPSTGPPRPYPPGNYLIDNTRGFVPAGAHGLVRPGGAHR